MGDWTDEFGWYDDLDRQEQEEERKARRAKLLTPPEPTQKPMHPELRKMWEDYFDKCFREFSAAQPAPVQEPVATDWERIAKVQDAKLRAMCNEPKAFEQLCELMDKYEALRPTPPAAKRQWVGLTDEEMYLNCPNWLSQEQCKVWIQQIEAKLQERNQ
jgi:hypothetical protein